MKRKVIFNMKCPHCSYESNQNFNKCPACGTAVSPQYASAQTSYAPKNPYAVSQPRQKSAGEITAMVIAIILAVISPIIAFVVLCTALMNHAYNDYHSYLPDYEYEYDYSSDYPDYDYYSFDMSDPIPKNMPAEFEEKLFSFSNDYVNTTYEVKMEETYRGDAAIKLLGNAKIPQLNNMQEIFLVKFNISITKQDTPAYVSLTSFSATAYNLNASLCQSLSLIDYKDNTQLLMEGENGTRWMAFVVDKDAENPIISWSDDSKHEFFWNEEESITDPSVVIEGDAVEPETADDDTSSIQ